MSKVFVLDTKKHPLNPVHPGRARLLLKEGKAAVFKRYPFTLILKVAVEEPSLQPLRLKIDPGAKALGATRWTLYKRLQATGLPVETGSGGLTKYNRSLRQLPKTHWLDAATVGASTPLVLHVEQVHTLIIMATGHGSRQMCRMDQFGFPRTSAKQARRVQGFTTGDLVRAVVKSGKKMGTYVGRVAIRSSGYFNITTKTGTIRGISYRSCHSIHRGDGYTYYIQKGEGGIPLTPEDAGILPPDS